MLNLIKSPKIIQLLFADFLWKIDTDEKVIYLTFDDGPHPVITPWIIDLMNKYDAIVVASEYIAYDFFSKKEMPFLAISIFSLRLFLFKYFLFE